MKRLVLKRLRSPAGAQIMRRDGEVFIDVLGFEWFQYQLTEAPAEKKKSLWIRIAETNGSKGKEAISIRRTDGVIGHGCTHWRFKRTCSHADEYKGMLAGWCASVARHHDRNIEEGGESGTSLGADYQHATLLVPFSKVKAALAFKVGTPEWNAALDELEADRAAGALGNLELNL